MLDVLGFAARLTQCNALRRSIRRSSSCLQLEAISHVRNMIHRPQHPRLAPHVRTCAECTSSTFVPLNGPYVCANISPGKNWVVA